VIIYSVIIVYELEVSLSEITVVGVLTIRKMVFGTSVFLISFYFHLNHDILMFLEFIL